MIKIDEIIGWYGAIALLAAFALNSANIINSNDMLYLVLNLTGALGITWIAFKKKTYQPAVLNCIWSIVALIGIIRIIWQ